MSPIFLLILLSPAVAFAQDPAPEAAATWMSVLPPAAAILVALVTRRVIPALFLGVWLGAVLVRGLSPANAFIGLLDSFQVYVLNALADPDRAAVILFSLMIGGMVGIVSRNGGMQGIVNHVRRFATSVRDASLATAGMGLAIFFDDYANTLVVGNTMRQITDAMRISRAKLAYLVDSTAAPVACIALVTTWIGYEVGLIGEAVANLPTLNQEPYLIFLASIPYSFYPILAIVFVLLVAATGRDFGPMAEAERLARLDGVREDIQADRSGAHDCEPIPPVEGKPHRAVNAVLPVVVLVLGVLAGLEITGRLASDSPDPGLREIIANADSYKALMWGSLLSVLTAVALTLAQRIMDIEETVNAWYQGMRAMLYAMVILVLAWALSTTTVELQTATFLTEIIGASIPAAAMPVIVFVLAALTAFATGSSWGAMGILVPLVVPLVWGMLEARGIANAEHMHLLYSSIASVLAGAVWGDHCSPISDTTILSSMASGCDHIEHVRTQLPYAIVVGAMAILTGSIPVALGMPWWLGLLLGSIALAIVLRVIGRRAPRS